MMLPWHFAAVLVIFCVGSFLLGLAIGVKIR